MSSRVAILALLVISAVAVLVFHSQRPSFLTDAARTVSTTEPEAIEGFAPVPIDSNLKFEVLRERVLTPYRLRLDRRLALAVAEIRRLAGAADTAVTAQFAAGAWTVRCGSQEVGKLSELPDFPEMLELLTECARGQAWAKRWADNTGPERLDLARALDRLDAPAALREADRAWAAGARDAALFRSAAHAYAMLALETPDWGGLADPIVARSLATLSFARALGAEDPKRETCLLAEVMGYSAAARERARQLPARDALRLYVTGNAAGLEQMAAAASHPVAGTSAKASQPASSTRLSAKSGTAPRGGAASRNRPATAVAVAAPTPVRLEASFLHLLQVARSGDYEKWSGLLTRFDKPGVPLALVLGTGTRIEHPEAAVRVADRLLQAMEKRSTGQKSVSRAQVAKGTGMNLAQQTQRFEAALDAQPPLKGGMLFGPEFTRAQRRSLAYAAIDRVGQHSLESLSAAEMSRWFAVGSRKSGAGKRAIGFQRWYAHLANARGGRPDLAALRADVDSIAPGPAQALRSYQALRSHLAADDPSLRAAAQLLVRRLDSRPEHRVELANIAERDLGALSLAERLGVSAAAVLDSSNPSLLVWKMRFQSKTDSLGAPATPAAAAPSDSMVGVALARKLAADPTSWEAAEPYAAWLEERKHPASARRVIERWVARTQQDSSSIAVRIDARTKIAHLHQLEGHAEQGLALLGDLHRTGHFGAMERTALILQDLGRPHQALAIAWAAHRGSPRSAAGHGLLADLFWRQARYDEAAKVLRDGRITHSDDWERDIAPRFVTCFRTRGREGLAAIDALTRAGFNDRATIGVISEALGAEGLHGLAFELQSRLRLTGPQQVEASLLAYGHLKRAKGEDAALQWIRRRVSGKDRVLLGVFAHQEGHPELLWSMPPSRLQGEVGDYYWLMRASACMTAGPSHRYHAQTLNHLRQAKGSYHLEVAKYLLGLREEPEVLTLAQTLKQRSEASYFAGLKAEQSGRLRDAADWYLLSVESGELNNAESRWAMQRLKLWTAEPRRFERSAPPPAPPA